MADDKRPRNAALYRVDRGKVTCVACGLTIWNGPAFDEPAGRPISPIRLFVVDVFGLDPATGALTGGLPTPISAMRRSGRTA